jgi:glycosyltransferase involved in cell wall biosynthesis
MVDSDVPIYTLKRLQDLGNLVDQLDLTLVHSHHAWVDTTCAELLSEFSTTAHVVTSHGMYDYMDIQELKRIGLILRPKTSSVSYVSNTNRKALLQLGFAPDQLHHIANAVPTRAINAVDRNSLGIPANSFVLCLVSRAMEEKGWREAIAATELLRNELGVDLHLLLIGEGRLAEQLKTEQQHADHIHLLGFRANTLDYFAGSDLGLLPTSFAGESQPLTLIECLMAGTPYIATRIGQIEAMLSFGGELAGSVVDLEDGRCSPRSLADAIKPFVLDGNLLQQKRSLAAKAAKRFSWSTMLDSYEQLYELSYHHLHPQVVK